MAKYLNQAFSAIFYISIFVLFIISGCANVRQPSGGPKDVTPPKVVKENPKNLNRNFSAEKINIQFDEFIKLNSEYTEISISPALDKMPLFKARKKLLEIKFEEPLEKNTTYTINFGKAIVDVNEGNALKNYSYVFSTGDKIDSLSISGNVSGFLTKEKLKDITVFIIPVKQDSIFGKKRANIFTSTDSAGNFRLPNLREDTYRIYALKEQNNDRIYNASTEEIGFLKDSIVLNKNVSDIKLEIFKESPSIVTVVEKKIENDGRILISFNKPLLNPSVKLLDEPTLESKKLFEITAKKDSALIWLPELTFDSLKVAINDNGKILDTVTMRRNKRDTYTKTLSAGDNLSSGKLKPKTDLLLNFNSPVGTFDLSKITVLEDSAAVNGLQIIKSENSIRSYVLKYPWRLKKEYILKFAENAFTDAFGVKSKAFNKKFVLDTEDNYGSISINVTVPDTSKNYLIEWLNDKQTVLRTDEIRKNTTLNYTTYPTAKYRIRVIYDENKNGKWDTGSIRDKKYPEHIWNFEKEISLRPNWDLEEKLTIPKDE
ncbi:MAG: Ig-like domain-containing domain [Daejeonella sp.]